MSKANETYQKVTDGILDLLAKGTAPWRKGWDASLGLPRSLSTKRAYRGSNVFYLSVVGMVKGYSSPWWGTYKQVLALGGQIRKGEKASPAIFWTFLDKKDTDAAGNETKKKIPLLRSFAVFNADQADWSGEKPAAPTAQPLELGADMDAALTDIVGRIGVKVQHGGSRACYSPTTDTVSMPHRDTFKGPAEYMATFLHELVHATGNKARLNRDEINTFHFFGDENYSREELTAEIGSAMACAMLGVSADLGNSAAYVAGWSKALKDDPKAVILAAGRAQKAVDLLLGLGAETSEEEPAGAEDASAE